MWSVMRIAAILSSLLHLFVFEDENILEVLQSLTLKQNLIS